jgi:RNA polymerase sigma factor (sigma-70 family)
MHRDFPSLSDLKVGDEAAWSIAFSYLWPVALNAARASAKELSLQEAEDAASEAIRAVVDQIDHAQSKEDLRALVAVIARRRAITIIRQKFALKRAPGGVLAATTESETGECFCAVDETEDPSRDAMLAEMVVLLRDALCGLEPQSRRLLIEKYVDGYSYDELSNKHELPVGTLCPKVMRALRQVRKTLEQSPELMKELMCCLR